MSSRTSVLLEEHTWPEVESALENGTRTIIVSVGSVEQHGTHLPLITDTLIGDELSRRIAEKLGDALAAPTIRPGCSGHHMEFPGTITVPPETLMDLIRSYCRSFSEHGFEHIVLVATHGGNFAPVNTVTPQIAREIDANVIALADLADLMSLMNEGLRTAGVEYEEPVIHAGAAETAIVLAVNEGLVRMDELEVGHEGEVSTARLLSEGFNLFGSAESPSSTSDRRERVGRGGARSFSRAQTSKPQDLGRENPFVSVVTDGHQTAPQGVPSHLSRRRTGSLGGDGHQSPCPKERNCDDRTPSRTRCGTEGTKVREHVQLNCRCRRTSPTQKGGGTRTASPVRHASPTLNERVSASRVGSVTAITENGVLGDPREATPEAGETILETVATAYVERIETERDGV